VTAGGDDKNPVLKLWDLRSSTSLPLATLQGHTEGILSVSWCPSDPSLLLSCGKDNRTMLWDLFHLQPVYDLPSIGSQSQGGIQSAPSADEHNFMFNNFSSTVGNRRYHVAWSPCLPAVISTCSFDRSVQFYSLSGAKSKLGRAPKWLRKPVGAAFGFGGKLATFDNNPNAIAEPKKGSAATATGSVEVKLFQVCLSALSPVLSIALSPIVPSHLSSPLAGR
jgi:protein transport protein SEC31